MYACRRFNDRGAAGDVDDDLAADVKVVVLQGRDGLGAEAAPPLPVATCLSQHFKKSQGANRNHQQGRTCEGGGQSLGGTLGWRRAARGPGRPPTHPPCDVGRDVGDDGGVDGRGAGRVRSVVCHNALSARQRPPGRVRRSVDLVADGDGIPSTGLAVGQGPGNVDGLAAVFDGEGDGKIRVVRGIAVHPPREPSVGGCQASSPPELDVNRPAALGCELSEEIVWKIRLVARPVEILIVVLEVKSVELRVRPVHDTHVDARIRVFCKASVLQSKNKRHVGRRRVDLAVLREN